MTNTNDFRRYSYQNDPTTLINSFSYTRGSQAPKVQPQPRERERDLKVRQGKGVKSRAELQSEQKAARAFMLRIAACAVICFLMIGLVINSLAVKNQLTRQIARQETAIANAESEYISLQSQLNALVSISMIDQYAVEKLGMTKVRSNQIQYMDVSEFKAQREKALSEQKNVDAGVKNLQKDLQGHN